MTYSSALRKTASDTLEEAQLNKYHRFLDQMNVQGANILEIGCGWGGFAEQAVLRGAKLTGLTLSEEQYRFAKQRVSGQAEILLQDYRDAHRVYDYVVSIEMFEAVGEKYWPVYFNKIKNCLVKGGKALIQTITIRDELFANYRKGTDYFRHYVFPGGFLPSKSAFCRSAQKVGLQVGQVIEFGHDYAWTLRQWLAKFTLAEESLIAEGRSESFLRAWRLYLNMCIAAFETKRTNVMQIILHR
jgi:cyclopropane-fatty-acyl-phospholipid synthase